MKKIFIFNIGMDDTAFQHKTFLEDLGYKVEIGPSQEENNYLKNNCQYYKEAMKQKIFSFASDVYRVYKLSTDKGLYIDITVELGKDFNKFYSYVSKYNFWAPKLEDIVVNSPILYGNKSIIAKELFNFYLNYDNKKYKNIRNYPILPRTMTGYFILKNLVVKNEWKDTSEIYKEENFCLGSLPRIMNKNTILKKGSGSWIDNKLPQWLKTILSKRGWKRFLKIWHKQKSDESYISEKIQPAIKLLKKYRI